MIKKIGILLSSPKEVGGIYQYSISLVDALNKLNKKNLRFIIIIQINVGNK